MTVHPQTLTLRYASILHGFTQLGYKTPLALSLRLHQAQANPHHRLDINLVPLVPGQDALSVQLRYTGQFILSVSRPVRSHDLFRLYSLNEMLKMRTQDVVA